MPPWFREFIAFTCGERYTMPLGVAGERPGLVRIYRGAGLYHRFGGGLLLLLAPRDPLLFYESVTHRLESSIRYEAGCPVVDESLGSWFSCNLTLAGSGPDYDLYLCDGPRLLAASPFLGYSRVYGCIVELLVAASKAAAGVSVPEGYAEGLAWCASRGSMGDDRVLRVVEWALQVIRGSVSSARAR